MDLLPFLKPGRRKMANDFNETNDTNTFTKPAHRYQIAVHINVKSCSFYSTCGNIYIFQSVGCQIHDEKKNTCNGKISITSISTFNISLYVFIFPKFFKDLFIISLFYCNFWVLFYCYLLFFHISSSFLYLHLFS